ncbi:hypothetical protein [Curtobacterium flaccumfaciens]|uniref:hypothetical protein n=1 Tax=Curtobacterium flaccumfaciens TaxID=2035 RepID=UPI001BDF3ECF|nr:hypothetical protein [Curtobacterium flaccumfaciens]MBT1630882.1 hypothetical protein [Curtobacterium flaccumfaciens pv. oortii]MCX2846608.1 hypothetical protein [Curtobacterium flaccumfaciens pv. oortii]
MTTYTVDEITVPATMDDDPAVVSVFREWVDVQNRAEVATTHLPELLWTPEEQLPYLLEAVGFVGVGCEGIWERRV